jgi:hypothetical protein
MHKSASEFPQHASDFCELPASVRKLRLGYYNEKTPRWYHGYGHVALTTSFCLLSFALCIWLLADFKLYYFAAFASSFLFTVLKEYFLHRYLLHRKLPILSIAFYEHAGQHHGYFTKDAMEARNHKDIFRVLMQPQDILFLVIILNVPIAWLLAQVFHQDIGVLHYFAGVAFFACYEFLHAVYHSPPEHVWHRLPWFQDRIQHHKLHHDKKLMGRYNFGVVSPLMDKLFNSYYRPA